MVLVKGSVMIRQLIGDKMRQLTNVIRDMISRNYGTEYCAKCGSSEIVLEPAEVKRTLSTRRVITIPGHRPVCKTCGHKGKFV
jgi:hypothetical protein